MSSRVVAVAAMCAAITCATGSATAAANPGTAVAPVSYRTGQVGDAVAVTLDGGVFALSADQRSVAVRDAAGTVLDTVPLTAELDGAPVPIRQQISADARTLTLTPDLTDISRASVRPVASPVENQLAMNDLINAVSLSMSVGSLIGTAIGAVAGVGIGVAVAGASCLVLSLGCVVAVLPIVTLAGAAGGIAGLVVAGGPTAAVAAYNYLTTLHAAPGTSVYAEQTGN
ncbi:hypothetical protein [Nocardia cyriacigeorgica]|uniref:hypothetical protein n=1 Tax=Nocardia cyriacigeorgica TaxID=135487 RepID=UPI002454785B|nr:hypothetical protein [Nocardia cyriacigeorgica]